MCISWYMRTFPAVENIIYYTYQDVTVTRIDKWDKVYFHYGRCNDQDTLCPPPEVVITWRDDFGLRGFLLFHPDKRVQVLKGGGGLYKTTNEGSQLIFMKEYESPQFHEFMEPFRNGPYKNLIEFSEVIAVEREINNRMNSHVQAEYMYVSEDE
jgi:hypothetical protein